MSALFPNAAVFRKTLWPLRATPLTFRVLRLLTDDEFRSGAGSGARARRFAQQRVEGAARSG